MGSGIESLSIPSTVKTIETSAFYYCASLKSLTVAEGVETIGETAFCNCFKLDSVTLPDSLTSIGVDAFDMTAFAQDPANWTDGVLYIDNHLISSGYFDEDLGFVSATGDYEIAEGTKTIANSAFNSSDTLTGVSFPESLTHIGEHAFASCSELLSISGGDGIEHIGAYAFAFCPKLEMAVITGSVGYIGNNAFAGCNALNDVYFEKYEIWSVNGSRLLAEDIANSETAATYLKEAYAEYNWIHTDVFQYRLEGDKAVIIRCDRKLSGDVIIPSRLDGYTVTAIDAQAFGSCTDITSVLIPLSITRIGPRAFLGCTFLSEVYFDSVDGWCAGETELSGEALEDPETAAKYFKETYYENGWTRTSSGNVDGEGEVDANDAIYLLYHVFFGEESYPVDQSCDFDASGSVDANDAIYLLYHVFFGEESYPLY